MTASTRTIGQATASKSFGAVALLDPETGLPSAGGGLPAGASTSAKQDTIIGHVDGIETLIGTTNTSLATIATNTGTPPKLITTTRTPVWASGQVITTSGTSAASTAITGTEVMISCTQDVWIRIGAATPTAAKDTAGSMFLKAGGPYTFQITTSNLVAAVQDSAAGKVSVIPVA